MKYYISLYYYIPEFYKRLKLIRKTIFDCSIMYDILYLLIIYDNAQTLTLSEAVRFNTKLTNSSVNVKHK